MDSMDSKEYIMIIYCPLILCKFNYNNNNNIIQQSEYYNLSEDSIDEDILEAEIKADDKSECS